MSKRHAARRKKLVSEIRKSDGDALLVSNESNVTWLTGFSGDSSWLLIGPGIELMVSDTRYTTQLKNECPEVATSIRDAKSTLTKFTGKQLDNAKVNKLNFEAASMTVAEFDQLKEAIKAELVPTSGMVEAARMIKDAGEIAEIRKAVWMAERGFACLKADLSLDQTELQVAHNLEHSMRRFGAERAGFHPIIAVGPNAALPHAQPGQLRVGDAGHLLVDWGAETTSNYRSDITRVLITGKNPKKFETIYNVVLEANMRAIDAIKPGAKCKDIDKIARDFIAKAGYAKYFGHGLGHGIGIDIHEQPRLSPVSDQVLEPGMMITVEPGIYIPGQMGVRIEDDVLVTKNGFDVLTSLPKTFDEAVVERLVG